MYVHSYFSRHYCQAAAEVEPVEDWVNPKIAQSEELVQKAYSLLSEKQVPMRFTKPLLTNQHWHDAFPLLESAAELQEKATDKVDPVLCGTLAVVYHELRKHKLAEGMKHCPQTGSHHQNILKLPSRTCLSKPMLNQ